MLPRKMLSPSLLVLAVSYFKWWYGKESVKYTGKKSSNQESTEEILKYLQVIYRIVDFQSW